MTLRGCKRSSPTPNNSSPIAFSRSRRWAKRRSSDKKELEDLSGAAKKLVDIVDPQEDGEASERPLLE
jgi:hypothetical protein